MEMGDEQDERDKHFAVVTTRCHLPSVLYSESSEADDAANNGAFDCIALFSTMLGI
jgi:hypothetical protein